MRAYEHTRTYVEAIRCSVTALLEESDVTEGGINAQEKSLQW